MVGRTQMFAFVAVTDTWKGHAWPSAVSGPAQGARVMELVFVAAAGSLSKTTLQPMATVSAQPCGSQKYRAFLEPRFEAAFRSGLTS